MTAKPYWTGNVPANAPEGVSTDIELKAGEEITILATGFIKYGKEEYALAVPDGRIKEGLQTKADKVLKARFGTSGKGYDIGSGVYKWAAPESGTLHIYIADTPTGYSDNTGSFSVSLYK
ncbi:LecA/PA-IL family lectin [Cronobacter sakazakii]|uniref:LecA/PA-IL family lectin n=1 Tax=Enterobacter sichuanensis TaxID=2071710 RepID=UPI0021CEFF63|nr:LecA/PA-IL family lectin [Enterobacter sichuanensis]MCU6194885.1 LecA/PA-IL family lectin [Enterobacter sichuanensis]